MTPSAEQRCFVCRAALAQEARFCGACGRPTQAHRRAVVARAQRVQRGVFRAAAALGAVMVAVLVGFLVAARSHSEPDTWPAVLEQLAVLAVAIAVGAVVLGRDHERAAAPRREAMRSYFAALPVAALTVVAALGYVGVLAQLGPTGSGAGDVEHAATAMAAVWLSVVVVAPCGEEFLCRGLVWRAGRRLSGPGTTLLLSAVLFAFLHGLGDGYLFELPHRFFGGLAYGGLRAWSGRLGPAILAHALHNAACLLLGE